MKLSVLGETQISVVPKIDNKEIMKVTIAAENRKEAMSMDTNKDETVDQFVGRLKSMLRSLLNAEAREGAPAALPDANKQQTWEEQKASLKKAK